MAGHEKPRQRRGNFFYKMLNSILGTKLNQGQIFDVNGVRVPVTKIIAGPCVVIRQKFKNVDGVDAVVVGFGIRRQITLNKSEVGMLEKAGLKDKLPRFLKDIKIEADQLDAAKLTPGQTFSVDQVFKEGDFLAVTGTSKGAGFAGVVKRHHFKGGPRTHGQSDRERAPGSIGQTTTPGRVYKGKRMAGRMGMNRITIKNLKVIKVDPEKNILTIKGIVPGKRNSLLVIKKI